MAAQRQTRAFLIAKTGFALCQHRTRSVRGGVGGLNPPQKPAASKRAIARLLPQARFVETRNSFGFIFDAMEIFCFFL